MKNGKPVPSHKDLIKCTKRDIDMSKTAEADLFKWYWEEVMGKVLGFYMDEVPNALQDPLRVPK